MKTNLILLTVAAVLLSGTQLHAQTIGKKILVAYFSHSGNTRAVAYDICKKVDGEFFEIQTVKPYSTDYNTVVDIAKRELKADFRPELKSKLKNSAQYDVIFVGYPNWWGTYPQAVKVFLSTHDFSGKTIIPFCTHEGSELGRSVAYMKKLFPKSAILEGLAIRGSAAHNSDDRIDEWLKKLKITK